MVTKNFYNWGLVRKARPLGRAFLFFGLPWSPDSQLRMTLRPFAALLPNASFLDENPEVLAGAKTHFPRLLAEGVYQPTKREYYYLLRISRADGTRRYGLAGLANAADYDRETGSIRPHEKTLRAREAEQARHCRDTDHWIKPILLTCPSFPALESWMRTYCETHLPQISYLSETRTQTRVDLFVPAEPPPLALHCPTGDIPAPVGVADGHHRIASARNLMEELPELGRVPVVLIPADSLGIAAFIRSVCTSEVDVTALAPYFVITECTEAELLADLEPRNWYLRYGSRIYRLLARKPATITDPEWFDGVVLPQLFGIQDSTTDERLVTTPADRGGRSLLELPVAADEYHFLPPPVRHADFFAKLLRREVFPPKSTRFYPRIPSGLIVFQYRNSLV